MTTNEDSLVCLYFRLWVYVSLCISYVVVTSKLQRFTCVNTCMHKRPDVWKMDINNPVWFFRSIQNTDKYTSTKYPPQLTLSARVVWLPTDVYNTITIWYTTMYHETFVVYNIQEPSVERASPSNIGLRQEDIIVIKNDIEKKKELITIFALSWNCCKCFTHVHTFLHWLNIWTPLKIILLLLLKPLLINNSQGFSWMWFQFVFVFPSQRQWQPLTVSFVIMKRGPLRFNTETRTNHNF